MTYFDSLLIANRGEIAVRVIRACRSLGIEAIAVYSDADARALHVREADRAIRIGPAAAAQSYLNIEAVLAAAQQTGAQAIHPGYGFLSENANFARACSAAGIAFVGPPAEAIEVMGSKSAAKRLAESVGVPTVPGYNGDDQSEQRLLAEAERIGFPLLIKASAGGGGKGMRSVHSVAEFLPALAAAQREALAAFGDQHVLLEKLIERPRHIEFQILGDQHGTMLHLGERECSIQRRHQKVLEESPSIALTPELRATMGAAAVRLAQAVNYSNAGTQEFMLDADGKFYFLEMNTRLQVEHPVTELVTGLDLVQLQIMIAAGERLPFDQAAIQQTGHAIEVRLYAEDPVQMLPSIGQLTSYTPPEGPGIRLDTGVTVGDHVTINYDPMLAKLIVWGEQRQQAIARLRYALQHFEVAGVTTNIPLLQAIINTPAYHEGATTTDFLQTHAIGEQLQQQQLPPNLALAARALFDLEPDPAAALVADPWNVPWRAAQMPHHLRYQSAGETLALKAQPQAPQEWLITIGDEQFEIVVLRRHLNRMVVRVADQIYQAQLEQHSLVWQGVGYQIAPAPAPNLEQQRGHKGDASLEAPMPGTIIKLLVAEGEHVSAGQPLLIMEAMKMEHTVTAPHAGTVAKLPYRQGQQVSGGVALAEISAE
ncbi:acetyl-CoA carboxylase biotin carboxylase subunit [Herpetosiphon geysericola]|uniref:Biotin-dependent 3-methylcrotonyl-coenzyme A carboxylase alpha1 subunit n=1 Tax=Herpetosiphon geysericola TaxID=70996 RepID=A0A0P6Y042_9CHLR|nr:acetyl-CoA carboxylase biotin carboxylase subunit [Herpetosiphon geysericola]KPL85755.1 3-methylcrotonyl-CoA carboxylase [Herpetosiphon geysericola]